MIQPRSSIRTLTWDCGWVQANSEVFGARLESLTMVGLESTLIAHGLPWPTNLETAREMQQSVQDAGAVPAMIAVLDGKIRVGLDDRELQRVAREGIPKAGVRDVPIHLATKGSAATTVSSTVQVASDLGISIVATGGIGGVHPGEAGDISSDLTVLSRCPLLLVCSGAKSVLDLPRTLERLETLGVSVVGYGTDEFPAFLSRSSGLPLEHTVETPTQAATVLRTLQESGGRAGLLLANPVPREHEIPAPELKEWVETAQQEAASKGIRGKETTPFLLARIQEQSQGRAMQSNRALAVSNARLAGQIANDFGQFWRR